MCRFGPRREGSGPARAKASGARGWTADGPARRRLAATRAHEGLLHDNTTHDTGGIPLLRGCHSGGHDDDPGRPPRNDHEEHRAEERRGEDASRQWARVLEEPAGRETDAPFPAPHATITRHRECHGARVDYHQEEVARRNTITALRRQHEPGDPRVGRERNRGKAGTSLPPAPVNPGDGGDESAGETTNDTSENNRAGREERSAPADTPGHATDRGSVADPA